MHDITLLGVPHLDHFSLRACFLVIGAFGVVTLISYINELDKAGLLHVRPTLKWMEHGAFLRRSLDSGFVVKKDDDSNGGIILQKDGDLHHLKVNLSPLETDPGDVVKAVESAENQNLPDEEIQITLHLQKKNRYIEVNDSDTKIYQFNRVLPNFYLNINESLRAMSEFSGGLFAKDLLFHNFTTMVLERELANYHNHTKVLVYQVDPNGYAVRDCFVSLAVERNLRVARSPLNAIHRKNWEKLDRRQRDRYDVLYGGLSFGVCESRSTECSYAVMVTHPLDRLLQAYWLCGKRSDTAMCQFLHTANITDVYQFVEKYGSAFFQKLLYYTRHCRLIGHNEMCIHDDDIYFLLSPDDKALYLIDILQNLERWFSVIGVSEELEKSLALFHVVFGLDFTKCLATSRAIPRKFFQFFSRFHQFHSFSQTELASMDIDGLPYFEMRRTLLENATVLTYLSADLKIYDKLLEIFHKQVSVYHRMKELMRSYYSFRKMNHGMSGQKGDTSTQTKSTDTFWHETTDPLLSEDTTSHAVIDSQVSSTIRHSKASRKAASVKKAYDMGRH